MGPSIPKSVGSNIKGRSLDRDSSQRPAPISRRPQATTKWRLALMWWPSSMTALACAVAQKRKFKDLCWLQLPRSRRQPPPRQQQQDARARARLGRRPPGPTHACPLHKRGGRGAHLARQVLLGLELLQHLLPRVAAAAHADVWQHTVPQVAVGKAWEVEGVAGGGPRPRFKRCKQTPSKLILLAPERLKFPAYVSQTGGPRCARLTQWQVGGVVVDQLDKRLHRRRRRVPLLQGEPAQTSRQGCARRLASGMQPL